MKTPEKTHDTPENCHGIRLRGNRRSLKASDALLRTRKQRSFIVRSVGSKPRSFELMPIPFYPLVFSRTLGGPNRRFGSAIPRGTNRKSHASQPPPSVEEPDLIDNFSLSFRLKCYSFQTDPAAHRNDLVCSVGFREFANSNARSSLVRTSPCQPTRARNRSRA
jgi:hypothetical protein